MTDAELMEALQAEDPEAMKVFVQRFSRRIFRYLYSWMKDREDAMDLTQEVLIRVYRKASLYRGNSPLAPWVFRIARNLFHDNMRRRNFKVHSASIELDEQIGLAATSPHWDPESAALSKEILERVQEAIQTLPDRQREVLQLRLLAEMKLDEIAQALGLSLGGVKSTLHNALNRLRSELSDLEGGIHV